MSAMAVSRHFEYAPHAARSVAMAITLALNFAIVLYALLPTTPYPVQARPTQSIAATVLQPPPPTVAPPPVPTLPVVPHVATPNVLVAPTHLASLDVKAMPTIALVSGVPTAITATGNAVDATATSSATIAYETATPPDYPIAAARAGIAGTVLLKVLVDTQGKPVEVAVAQSSGSRLLDDAARRHVLAAWRFHPALRAGRAIEAWALVPVRFSLDRG